MELNLNQLRSFKTSDRIYILGSGESILDISKQEWDEINSHNSIGFNHWYVHDFEPTFSNIRFCVTSDQYGFATIASIGMGWFIYFIYKYVTTSIKKKLGEMNTVLIALIDRVRMLDNDIIRLRSKVNTVLELREKQKKKSSK